MRFDVKGFAYHTLGDNGHLFLVEWDGKATDISTPATSGGGGGGDAHAPFAGLELGLSSYGYSYDHYSIDQYNSTAWQSGAYAGSSWTDTWASYDVAKSWSPSGETTDVRVSYGNSWGDNYAGPGYQFGDYHYDSHQATDVFSEYFGKDGSVSLFSQTEQVNDSFDFKSFATPGYVSETGHGEHSDIVDTHQLTMGPQGFSFFDQHAATNDTFDFSHLQIGAVGVDQQHSDHIDLSQTIWGNASGQGAETVVNQSTHDFVQVQGPDFVQTDVQNVTTQAVHDHAFFLV